MPLFTGMRLLSEQRDFTGAMVRRKALHSSTPRLEMVGTASRMMLSMSLSSVVYTPA